MCGTYKLLVFSDKLNKLCDLTVINYIPGSIHIRFVIWQCSLITSGRASGRVIEVCLLVHDIEQVERHTYTKNKKKTRLKRLLIKPTKNWFLELASFQPSPKINKSGSIWHRLKSACLCMTLNRLSGTLTLRISRKQDWKGF